MSLSNTNRSPMPRPKTDAALSVWAVTCDALARGEQIFLLLPGAGRDVSSLRHEKFWLLPDWDAADPLALTEPYRDRMRALESLRHGDSRARVKYFATAEYAEIIESPRHLRALDGDHTLAAGAVSRLFETYGTGSERETESRPGVSLLVLRVSARPEAALQDRPGPVPGRHAPDDGGGDLPRPVEERWCTLSEPVSAAPAEPVVDAERFLSRKARLLQRTGAVRAV